jgi:hypothetical protein
LLIDFFAKRGVDPEVTRWKYLDERFNRGRERAFVWHSKGRVRGMIGMIPLTLSTPAGDRSMVWTCDWLLEDPLRSPGIGIKLLDAVRARYGFVAGIGGSEDTHALVPRMDVRIVSNSAMFLHRAFNLGVLLEKFEQRFPKVPKLSRTPLRRVALPTGKRGRSGELVRVSDGVAPAMASLFDQPAPSGQCRVRYEQAHLEWYLGRSPGIRVLSCIAGAPDLPSAGALLWRRADERGAWRAAYRCRPGQETALWSVVDACHDQVSREGGAILSTMISHLDQDLAVGLKQRRYLESAQRWPLYITAMAPPMVCEEGLAQMSYLDTDIACAF